MIEIAGLAVAGVAALGTLVQAYYAAKKAKKEMSTAALKKAEKRAGSPLKIGIKKVAEVIDDELLATLQAEIETQNRNLIRAFQTSTVSDHEREEMVEAARMQICRFLAQVKRFNEGMLPTKRLEKLWVSNKCKT